MSNNDAFDLGDFEDFDAPSLSPEDDVDLGPVAGTQAPRNTRFILLATVLVIVILVGAVGIVLAALDAGQKQRDYQATVNAVNMTNAQIALFITQTNIAKSWTPTPSPTLTPSFTPTPTYTNTPTPTNTPTFTATIDTTGTQAALDAQASGTAAILQLTFSAQQLTQTAIVRQGTINALTQTANVPPTQTLAPVVVPAATTGPAGAGIGDLVKTIQANNATIAAITKKQGGTGATPVLTKQSLNSGQGVALQITSTPTPSLTRAFVGGANAAGPNKNSVSTLVALVNLQGETPTSTPSPTGSPDVSIPTLIPLDAVTATLLPATPDLSGSATAIASVTPATVSPEDANATANAQAQNLIATNNAIANQIATLAAQTQNAPSGGNGGVISGSINVTLGPVIVITPTPQPTITGTIQKTIAKGGFFDDLAAGKATPGSLAVVGLAAVSLVAVIVAARRLRAS